MISNDRVRDFYEAAFLQSTLNEKGYSLVFVDEFHVSLRSDAIYNWSPRNCPATVAIDQDPWIMSFVVAASSRGIEGIKAATESINTRIFWWFLEDVWSRINADDEGLPKPVVILDNATLHTSSISAKFMADKGIRWVSITPYSPQLNAAEKVIAAIKAKLRKEWIANTPLSLMVMKRIVDEVHERCCEGSLLASRLEIYNKMKQLQVR